PAGRARPGRAGRPARPGAGWRGGPLAHALLEPAGGGPRRDRAHLERIARWLTMDNPELRRVVPEALDTVERVLTSDLWQQALAAAEMDAEIPFAARVAAAAPPPTILYGVIDLAFRTAAGWSLIDYKTDQADLATLTARHGSQICQYARHWTALTGAQVSYAGLYGVRDRRLSADLQEE